MKLEDKVLTVIGILFLISLILISGCLVFSPGLDYGDGERTGVIYKLSKKGLIWKTWEGEMALGFNERNSDNNIATKVFKFTVQEDSVALKIQEALNTGKRVTIQYRELILRGCKYGSTGYDVTGLKY